MRQVTADAVNAFIANNNHGKSNTTVVVQMDTDTEKHTQLLLHGNLIAERINSDLYITDAGWQTNTTKERLNGLLSEVKGGCRIEQKKGVWFLSGYAGTGEMKSGKRYKIAKAF